MRKKLLSKILIFLLVFALGGLASYSYFKNFQKNISPTQEKNTPKAFLSEVFDKIKDNYWNNIGDGELLDLFKLAVDKNGGQISVPKFDNKDKFLAETINAARGMNEEQRNKFFSSVVASVLSSLSPAGRSGLYNQKLEADLKNTVSNINPGKDLYQDLGLNKNASEETVAAAYQKKQEELKSESSPEAEQKKKEIAYAKDVLTQKDTKTRYDQNQIEPTIFTKVVTPGILYFQFKKFSPTTYDEFVKAFNSEDPSLYALILDLRANVGGAIDGTAYFLGNFLGKNQYAFDFYHKGEYLPFKTPTDKLASIAKFKQIVMLVDNQTQSSAEMMTASFKRYHLGVVLGTPTKGWGTVERVFPLDNQFDKTQKYSLFLVHSITLRDDNQPIEGRGVDPDINIKNDEWPRQLFSYFRNQDLIQAVKGIL